MAYLSGYSKYKVLTLTGGASGAQNAFQLKLAVSYEAAMQGEFDDIRFTQADGTTLVDAWAELIVTDTSATVWVEFPSTPANTVEQIYRMYYGNAGAANYWDIAATFQFGNDFDDNDISDWSGGVTTDGSAWNTKPSVASGEVYAPSDIKGMQRSGTTKTLSTYRQRMRVYIDGTSEFTDIGITNPTTTYSGYQFRLAAVPKTRVLKTTNAAGAATTLAITTADTPTGWHTFEVVHKSDGKFAVYFDDALQGLSTDVADTAITQFNNTNLRIRYTGDKHDWFFVGKYAANPPTYAFGAEQSVPTGGARPSRALYGPFRGPFGGPI